MGQGCVRKADTGIEGSYAMINYEYANHIDEQYIYVNREEEDRKSVV